MEEFARTRRGSKFFDADLPKIASMLERIAIGLEEKNKIEEKKLILEQKKWLKENREEAKDEKIQEAKDYIANLRAIKNGLSPSDDQES
jgi:hypothetical protein